MPEGDGPAVQVLHPVPVRRPRDPGSTTLANASLISITSRSSMPRPVCRSTPLGGRDHPGEHQHRVDPARANPTNRASGPRLQPLGHLPGQPAAARPPVRDLAGVAAVTCPSGRKAGFSTASFSMEVSRRTPRPPAPRWRPRRQDLDRDQLAVEAAGVLGGGRARRWGGGRTRPAPRGPGPHFSVISSAEVPWGTGRPW